MDTEGGLSFLNDIVYVKNRVCGFVRLFFACMVTGGVQYGWALQLSLLSPYSQTLGIPHHYVPLTWIYGPIAGFVILIIISMSVTMYTADEKQLDNANVEDSTGRQGCIAAFSDLFKSLKNLPPSMFKVLAVTAVTWLAWLPFIQYGTDWMGREIYHGEPQGPKAAVYYAGVRDGAGGLLLSSICLLVASFNIPHLCRRLTSRVMWSLSNFIVFGIMMAMVILGLLSTKGYNASFTAGLTGPDPKIRVIALSLFTLTGIPQAVLFSVPWAIASKVADDEDGGQGLVIGVLNIAIVVPQLIIALTVGPIDKTFEKGNTPAFSIGGAFAFICTVLVLVLLPKTRGTSRTSNTATMAAGEH